MGDSKGLGPAPEVRIGDAGAVTDMLAAAIETPLRSSLAERQRFTIAIPGGSVATRCFPRLAGMALDWSSVDFFWVDERTVPPGDPLSNHAVAQRLWLGPAKVPPARIHRMRGEADDLGAAARTYADELKQIAGDPPQLDCVLLGVGPDGHVASLFPGDPALTQEGPVLVIEGAPKPPARRLSLSLSVLTQARKVMIVAFGAGKARVIHEALADAGSTLPVARVAREARNCVFLLDRAAGGQVGKAS